MGFNSVFKGLMCKRRLQEYYSNLGVRDVEFLRLFNYTYDICLCRVMSEDKQGHYMLYAG